MITLRSGDLAYVDSFGGLLPCKVLSVARDEYVPQITRATVQLTANRQAFRRGEILTYHARFVVPRAALYVRSGQYRIRAYDIATDATTA